MSIKVRKLNINDYAQVLSMDTGIEDDYILSIYDRLIDSPENALYGMFINDKLVSFAGYTIYANTYAMLGRLRSDLNYRGRGFATELMSFVLEESLKLNHISWVGANTQENNLATRRVLEKIGLKPFPKLYGVIAEEVSSLEAGENSWTLIHNIQRKKEWINKMHVNKNNIFPYECYYPFPASKELFPNAVLSQWSFYENKEKTRFIIMKPHELGDLFLHTVYPWNDLMNQPGLWETIANEFHTLKRTTESDTYIWMDLSPEAVQSFPKEHPFKLDSPWILHGKYK